MARKRPRKIPAIVPKLVFSTVFVGVIPACVVVACGSEVGGGGVANTCFNNGTLPCKPTGFGVADSAFRPDVVFSVAQACFDGGVPCDFDTGAGDGQVDGSEDASDDADDAG